MNQLQNGPEPGVYRFQVAEAAAGARLDHFLAGCSEHFSRSLARRLIEIGGVHVDGRRMRKCGATVSALQNIEVFVDGLPLTPFVLDSGHIIYQDTYLLAINKPAGVVTQPTPARYRGSLYDALQRYLADGNGNARKASIGMVQRLDRDTSGVLIFSIHPRAHKILSHSFSERSVRKVYRVLVVGELSEPAGIFRSQLARRRSTNLTVSVSRGGRYAETHYRVVTNWGCASLLEVELVTGRTHQIRAHFSEAGHPLLGDTGYGGPDRIAGCPVPRQMLHAAAISLVHPVSNNPVCFQAPIPDDFQAIIAHLDANARAEMV